MHLFPFRVRSVSRGTGQPPHVSPAKAQPHDTKDAYQFPHRLQTKDMKHLLAAILSIAFTCIFLFGTAACTLPSAGPSAEKRNLRTRERSESAGMQSAEGRAPSEAEDTRSKRIWLTFDDGPTDSTTPKILDILKNENVKATFFVVGRQIANREKILLREAAEGHAIGIHTYTHEYNKIYASADALRKDIDLCSKAIRSVLPDFNTDLYRFPGGSYNVKKELVEAVEKAGYRHYDWNCSAEDAVSPNTPASVLYQNVLDSAGSKNEVILLMHDGVGYKETIRCLPAVIDYFREREFAFCTL